MSTVFRGELMELIGRVLWWSEKNENGIIVDPTGNEFYFDRSVLHLKPTQTIKRKEVVIFHYNDRVSDCLCAREVKIPSKRRKASAEKEFTNLTIISL